MNFAYFCMLHDLSFVDIWIIEQESYQTYLNRLYKVWKGCYDKLSEDGSLWLNINIRTKDGSVILIPRDFVLQCKKMDSTIKVF